MEKETTPIIWIEEKDYKDKVEFRIKIKDKYPDGLNRKGTYERYMSEWIEAPYNGGSVDICFVAKKHSKNYSAERITAIDTCDKLVNEYKKSLEVPKTHKIIRPFTQSQSLQ
ncbi:MAG: hypothetical protein KAJ54_01805 [Candidatus Aenigmarchaeota archaeon]|nr:hypothetical protein [Candidatus Aenigmarchaeota archaeon]